ncbi:WhiB family transcriptional regulator [Streptomyces sp. NPDC006654]|uniref:WhiB family transcriptional regulator n=1 Tax=Streptomyces sp. NPDC006654 TaxID=3156897 RepID=UPI0033FD76FA
MNLTVVDHIAEGRDALARAAKLAGEGSTLAQREARAIREAQAMKSEAIIGTHYRVRSMGCPSCGCLTLLPKRGRAWCVNRHCAVGGRQRSWDYRELAFLGPGAPKRVQRTESERPPRDVMDVRRLLAFFTQTGVPMSASTLRRLIKLYELPRWYNPMDHRSHLYALSDVATAHAAHLAHTRKGECTATATRPPCTGLHEMFFTASEDAKTRTAAKQLCEACPLRQACLDTAMTYGVHAQHGIFGGLTAGERRALKSTS